MSRISSPSDEDLLAVLRLAGETPVSGTMLANRWGISRAAIWKRICALRERGFTIEAIPRDGYRLCFEPDLLTLEAVAPLLRGCFFTPDLYHFWPSLNSTNTTASEMARCGAREGSVVVAESQTQGRGRLGRIWVSPAGLNLAFSLILRPILEPRYAAQITLLTGLALAEAVREAGLVQVVLKWPNDLMVGEKKLAGILTEMEAEADHVRFIIVGIGMNFHSLSKDFPADLADVVTSFAQVLKKTVKRNRFLADFLYIFENWYRCYLAFGFAPIRQAWLECSQVRGRMVRVNLAREQFSGEAVDLDAEGFLLVKREDGKVCRVVAGDVTLK
ncbi:MAG: biotin--[acetyl-CoA-carboxylase] ligase [Magnetococcus sp. DMHC-6]